ncbi:MAG: CPBP family intramembrane metalloprotease [Xanthomonadaceae bacterium]|nr:CPBP family intramembrane metalloprotease [Xanthomonadaceae bacterium]MDE1959842.1 CPBP family intramembrane metalloprotease [Xanthomonadaceae bacterium]MDE2178137.1 CPBP family intramembrane metalloprotease [Xanthomonadaceae bacterium]MDE2246295.1 CPBP family intramembrane metalloprotease [Xanthomonadaceae bacterium]
MGTRHAGVEVSLVTMRVPALRPFPAAASPRQGFGDALRTLSIYLGLIGVGSIGVLRLAAWLQQGHRLGGHPQLVTGIALVLAQLVASALTLVWLRGRAGALWSQAALPGYGFRRTTRRWVLGGEAGGLVLAIAAALLGRWLDGGQTAQASLQGPLLATGLRWSLTGIGIVLSPWLEETVFRGALLGALAPALGTLGAVLASTLVFTLLHAFGMHGHWWGLLPIAALGLFCAALRVRSGSLAPGIIAHTSYNVLAGLGGLL